MTSDEARGTIRGLGRGRIARGVGAIGIGIWLAAAGVAAAGEEGGAAGFAAQVEAQFDRWDRDRDGALSFRETSTLVPDATIRGEAAAALAAIHLAQRSKAGARASYARGVLLAAPAPSPATAPTLEFEGGVRPPFETLYRVALAHIRTTDRALFANGGPSLQALHQGLLGDCYFVATLGALISRDAGDVARIVGRGPGGSFDVRFPDGEPVRVPHVSDAEVALGSFDGRQGLWLNVLEKAYGLLVERAMARRGEFEDAIDAVGDGGHATSALTLFTGRDAAVLRFRTEDDPMTMPGSRRVEGFLPMTRALLAANLRQGRLTCCDTSTAETPPGIARCHLYAVLGFDPASDLVHVWNPWGISFQPRSAPGLGSGYATRQGHFSVPLADFLRIFDSLVYETDRPADPW
jgi:hypothetical protein